MSVLPEWLDKAGATYLASKIKALQALKVDKVDGKGLSTNDYTTEEKNKLDGIAAGAEVNVQSDWDVTDTGSDAFIKNKPSIPVVDNAMSDSSINTIQNKVVKAYIDDLISTVSSLHFEIVESLPEKGQSNIIYLVPRGSTGDNRYEEFVWIEAENRYESLGYTTIDLSDYVKKEELVAITNEEIDAMFT